MKIDHCPPSSSPAHHFPVSGLFAALRRCDEAVSVCVGLTVVWFQTVFVEFGLPVQAPDRLVLWFVLAADDARIGEDVQSGENFLVGNCTGARFMAPRIIRDLNMGNCSDMPVDEGNRVEAFNGGMIDIE